MSQICYTLVLDMFIEACRIYFKSLVDDKRRKDTGNHTSHRRSLKLRRRIKQVAFHARSEIMSYVFVTFFQKVQRRRKALEHSSAADLLWSNEFKTRVKHLLSEDYMSSETSADESDKESYAFKTR